MPVEMVSEEVIQPETPRLRLVPPVEDWSVPTEPPEKPPIDARVLQVMEALAKVLAVRAMIFVAVIFTFVLACWAMYDPTPMRLIAMVLWSLATLGPLTYLARRG